MVLVVSSERGREGEIEERIESEEEDVWEAYGSSGEGGFSSVLTVSPPCPPLPPSSHFFPFLECLTRLTAHLIRSAVFYDPPNPQRISLFTILFFITNQETNFAQSKKDKKFFKKLKFKTRAA